MKAHLDGQGRRQGLLKSGGAAPFVLQVEPTLMPMPSFVAGMGVQVPRPFMRKRILIVDDNNELLALMRSSFRAAGFSIATATNGIEALKKARSVAPDLILLDLVLPELDGFAVCETLRRGRATASIPIVILSGLTSEFTRLAGMESGANYYFVKPIKPSALIAHVREILTQPEAAAHTSRHCRREDAERLAAAKG